jgi:hypothetical protein
MENDSLFMSHRGSAAILVTLNLELAPYPVEGVMIPEEASTNLETEISIS